MSLMDSKDPHAMTAMAMSAQTLPHNLEIKIHHPNHSSMLFPQSQPSIPSSSSFYPHAMDNAVSQAAVQRPYGTQYLHHHQQPNPTHFSNPEQQKIHTLFISGLPDDVKAREIHNLFRRRQGFDSCQLKYTGRGNQVVAFATFFNHQAAVAAMDELNGRLFNPETGATLHVELARANSRTNRPRGTGAYAIIDKRAKLSDDTQETESNDGDGGSDEPSGTANPSSSNKGAALASTQSGVTTNNLDISEAGAHSGKATTTDIPPCSTLFIANLGPSCTEEELKQVLSAYPGFHLLKMRARGGMPVAFADFEMIEQATKAMNGLQDSLLTSSDRGGLHLEYARSKMRKR